MQLTELSAISPVDGRYRQKTEILANYFSEFALMRYRVKVEVEYFIALCRLPLPQLNNVDSLKIEKLRKLAENFTLADAKRIKEIEKVTNHDVKAVEYFLKERLDELGLSEEKEFLHFGLTSQDVNNTATPMLLRDAIHEVIIPAFEELTSSIEQKAKEWNDVAMLARTHGQPASPTRLGKELAVFSYRLRRQLALLKQIPHSGKFGGATGNFNAHSAAFPDIEWTDFANEFLGNNLGIEREQLTTQISNYDNLSALLDNLRRLNTIVLDFNRDVWTYISLEYFKQKIKQGEVGSSAMPHKVNPIDFENSEGNMGIANALLTFLSQKLPVSRLQRDLTDSTVLRNLGTPLAHILIALSSTMKGIDKLLLNRDAIAKDLDENIAVIAEGIQTILRREGYPKPYEALKALTRNNNRLSQEDVTRFIDSLDVSDTIKNELKKLRPNTYTGVVAKL